MEPDSLKPKPSQNPTAMFRVPPSVGPIRPAAAREIGMRVDQVVELQTPATAFHPMEAIRSQAMSRV